MKTKLALTALAVVIVCAFAVSAVPAYSHRGDHGKPGLCFIDENKDGVCDRAPGVMANGKWQGDDKTPANSNCPRNGAKGHGWGMKGGKMCPNLPDSGNGESGVQTK
ncbi:MAG: hypothetical protein HQK86_04675 [Nitrospinae bacterium]|nr:hypothetical protein [Nitrospinota bacterium]MBF0633920.1 hypothetical protein [Nitrospinota bacterium]